jgi:site-specific DNA-methyltransferase (cytosine-N4-specific)
MGYCFGLFRECMSPTAIVCFLVGRSIIRGKVIDNAALLEAAARANGFSLLASADRAIPTTRKSFNPAHSTISAERLLVFQRKGSQ